MIRETYFDRLLVRSLLKAASITAFIAMLLIIFLNVINSNSELLTAKQQNPSVKKPFYLYPLNYHLPINNFYTYYIDSSYKYSIDTIVEIQNRQKFTQWNSNHSSFNLGINAMPLWFYIHLKNESTHDQCFIWELQNTTDTAQLFIKRGNEIKPHPPFLFEAGLHDRSLPLGMMYDTIWMSPNSEAELYMHVWKSHHNVYLPMSLLPLEEALNQETYKSNTYCIYISIFVFIILFNLFLYYSLRDKIHLWYSFTILSVCLFLITDAFYDIFLFPDFFRKVIIHTETLPFVNWCVVGSSMFMQLLLQQNRKNSYLWFPLKILIILDLLLGLGQLVYSSCCIHYGWTYPFHSIHIVSDFLVTITDFLIVTSIMEKIVQKQRLALFYFFTTLLPVMGMLNFYLNTFAYTNFRFLYPNSIAAGVMLEIIILTFMLTERYNLLQQDKNLLLQQHIDLQREQSEKVLQKQEEERARIARDLHDGVVGYLGALRLYINTLILNLKQDIEPDKLLEPLLVIQKRVDKVITDIRNTSHDLMPVDFDAGNFFEILTQLFEDLNKANKVKFSFIADESINGLTPFIQINIYRIILELTNNIIQHSKASNATIQYFSYQDYLLLQIEDNGIGFDKKMSLSGIGLKSIFYRIELMKGKISIDSNPDGTVTIIEIPQKYV